MRPSGPALFVLGGIELRHVPVDRGDRLLAQSKCVALLTYLALSPEGRHQRRDGLVALFWPELDQAHARGALRKSIHLIRSTLGADALVTRGDEDVALASSSLWCDARELLRAANAGQLARAVELYRGDLMPGFHLSACGDFDTWVEQQRTLVLESVVAASWALAQTLEASSQLTDAAHMARHSARLAWNDERILRRSLAMLDRLGDRAGALRLFEAFARRLKSDLDAEPSAETRALVASMKLSSAT